MKTLDILVVTILSAVLLFFVLMLLQKDIKQIETQPLPDSLTYNGSDDVVLQKTELYEIVLDDNFYYCLFYDQNGTVKRTEGPLTRLPRMEIVEKNVVKFTLQTGTGLGTQWGYYFDTEANIRSDVFCNVFDQKNGLVAYAEKGKVVVRDIFDKEKIYMEFASFQYILSSSAEPITDVVFSCDGKHIEVTYLSGEDYIERTESFCIS